MNAMELKRGFHLAVEDSRIIPTGNGVFIEYDGFLSKKMEGLRAHRLNALASGLRERRMREYRPGSEMIRLSRRNPVESLRVWIISTIGRCSSCSRMSGRSRVSVPRTAHTSRATNLGSPLCSITRREPNFSCSKRA